MSKLIKLELKRNSLKAYFLATVISFLVMIGFTYLIASIPRINGNSADTELFMSYHFIVSLSCVVCMGIFSITAGVMSSKFIVEEYTCKRAILLLSYPVNRKKILNSKIFLTFFYTTVSMLLCEGMTLGIFTVILVIVILLHRNLCYRVEKMEV